MKTNRVPLLAITLLGIVGTTYVWWLPSEYEPFAPALNSEPTNPDSPASPATINDLAAPLSITLGSVPGVAGVEVRLLRKTSPRRRIVHFLDWHYVDRDVLAKDGRTDWEAFLGEVERVQLDQATALDCLVLRHGLKRVLVEGLTEADMLALPDKVAHLREAEAKQPALKAQLAEVQALIQTSEPGTERCNEALAKEASIAGMLAGHRTEMLKMGAAIRLLMSGRLEAVLPLDDAKLLDAAGPIPPGSKHDNAAVIQRQAAMVRNALASGRVAVIICAGSHDLGPAIRRQDPYAEYDRVATPGYHEVKNSAASAKRSP
jgi:hypothetical protein